MRKTCITLVMILLTIVAGYVVAPGVASGATVPSRLTALRWARTQAGRPYQWGGTGHPGYDCSGLVMEAYAHAGISLPHSTYAMLSSGKLARVYAPQPGDLAFFGSGHVELVTREWHTVFGAQQGGVPVGWQRWGGSWRPTAYYRVR